MEILIGLTILAVIVRVVIFFCAPELDETLSGFNSPEKILINLHTNLIYKIIIVKLH